MKTASTIAGALAASLLALSIPGSPPDPGDGPVRGQSFVWNQDSLWIALESQYVAARESDCDEIAESVVARSSNLQSATQELRHSPYEYDHPIFDSLETAFFDLAPAVAACPDHLPDFVATYREIRDGIKHQSRDWDVNTIGARQRLYRSLYGGRAAVEEVMLQHSDEMVTLVEGRAEPSATPSVEINGLQIHSGDILVSRGGYPTSALISRGNDYPGNFSHIALVHVDDSTRQASIIEAHIEVGVTVATAEQYLQDKKLRIMVLRPRADLPALTEDPMLPHRAATLALEGALGGHIPYDFEMDYNDPSRLFCSEVASAAYGEVGITLWMGLSTISSDGLRRWLSAFGVRHFETQEPSDLEYDPQLAVVAEWRDPETLFKDHIDNAVIDVMLEGAERGDDLDFEWYRLAPARIAKAYSWLRNQAGGTGPIPEGMSPAAALRNKSFSDRHDTIAATVYRDAMRFRSEQGYPPPYWKLIELSRLAVAGGGDD
jgi:hypothetical protein